MLTAALLKFFKCWNVKVVFSCWRTIICIMMSIHGSPVEEPVKSWDLHSFYHTRTGRFLLNTVLHFELINIVFTFDRAKSEYTHSLSPQSTLHYRIASNSELEIGNIGFTYGQAWQLL